MREKHGQQRINVQIVKERKSDEVRILILLDKPILSNVSEKEILEVHIDKGMQNGQKIPFRGMADEEPGIEAGDVIIILREAEHDVFQRKGSFLKSSNQTLKLFQEMNSL